MIYIYIILFPGVLHFSIQIVPRCWRSVEGEVLPVTTERCLECSVACIFHSMYVPENRTPVHTDTSPAVSVTLTRIPPPFACLRNVSDPWINLQTVLSVSTSGELSSWQPSQAPDGNSVGQTHSWPSHQPTGYSCARCPVSMVGEMLAYVA